jgi:Arm DNA-binding domain/Phage integrase, N-terminal SAM-like domain
VGSAVFKTVEAGVPRLAGSIPVRLRYLPFSLGPPSGAREISCLLARFWCVQLSQRGKHVIRKRDGYWQVKVYAGRDPLTGKERYEYDRARTKREAERVEAALKTKVAEGRHRGTAARTVADLVERWYEWRQGVKEISPTTLLGYRLQIDRRIIPALGRTPARLATPPSVQRADIAPPPLE